MKIIPFTVLFVCQFTGTYVDCENTESTTISPDVLLKRYQLECIEETRVNPDIIVSLNRGRWQWRRIKQPIVKDWALCVLMKNQLMTKEGVYKVDVALKRVPLSERDVVEKQIDKCLTPKAIPGPDIALNFMICFQRNKSNYSSLVSGF